MSQSKPASAVTRSKVDDRPGVILIKPRGGAFSSFPPLNLMLLAASLKARGASARVLDLCYEADRSALESISHRDAPRMFGLTATTPEFGAATRLVRWLKTRFPGVPVVVGGVHVSAIGAEAVEECGADFGVAGEGDDAICEILDMLVSGDTGCAGRISGLIFRTPDGVWATSGRAMAGQIDSLPLLDWDCVESERYFAKPWGILQERARTGFIITSRGCPNSCRVCGSSCATGNTFRGRDPVLVVDEMESLCRRHGVREFLIAEDNFTHERHRALAICEEILRRGLNISWRTPNGVEAGSLDVELVKAMRRSGCYLTGFSIESADAQMMDTRNRAVDLDRVIETVSICRREGMLTFGGFLLGAPGESRASAMSTIRIASRSGVDIAHFGAWAPYPGSPDFERFKNHAGARDWDGYLMSEPHPCSDMDPGVLKGLMRRAYLDFYFRPARARLYAKMLKPAQAAWAFRAMVRYLR